MKPTLKLQWCSFEAAKFAVEHWHYSERMPSGKLIKIGVWEDEKFIGCILFGRGANNCLGKPYGMKQTQCCELVRIALTTHVTPVSRIISIALKMIAKFCPDIKMIVSFADTDQNHHGGVYQASNWVYAGKTTAAEEYIVNGKRMHGRSMRALYGTHIDKPYITKVMGSSKHRYLYFLDKDFMKELNLKSFQNPKRLTKANHDVQS